MPSVTFPNGETLTSDALTPQSFMTLLQPIIASILGIDPVLNPQTAWNAVRVGWQQQGQPAPNVSTDVCVLTARPVDHPYSRVRDSLITTNDYESVNQQMAYTQVWNLHLIFYGNNAEDHARLVASAAAVEDWVNDSLAASNLYLVADYHRPQYNPEYFQGQWWPRADLDLQFNEEVSESIIIPSAASVEIVLETDNGTTESINISTDPLSWKALNNLQYQNLNDDQWVLLNP